MRHLERKIQFQDCFQARIGFCLTWFHPNKTKPRQKFFMKNQRIESFLNKVTFIL